MLVICKAPEYRKEVVVSFSSAFWTLSSLRSGCSLYTSVLWPIMSLTLMAFLLLTQTHSKYIEQLSRFILIIFQHPAQDICLSRTTPALPFFKEPLGGTPISVGSHVHPPTVNKVASFVWVSSFTTISRWRVFSRPSGASLRALPTVLNTTYHACSYFSLIGWRLKSIGMCFFMLILFLNHLSLQY